MKSNRPGGAKGGWSGNIRPDTRLERELYGEEGKGHVTGINFDKYDDIPVETSGDGCPKAVEVFTKEDLGEQLCKNLKRSGFNRPTPVQKYSIPIGKAGRDLMACAQTGSGKTGGFLFPVIAEMLKHGPTDTSTLDSNSSSGRSNYRRKRSYPCALIVAPTRELASQIYNEARKFCYCTGVRPVVVYGGARVGDQLREIERGCDLMVATPGRLVDLIERGRVSLAAIKYLILDEADRMLDMGFEPQIRRIVSEEDMPREGRQTFMFSATFPEEIQRLAADFMHDYIFLAVGRVGSAAKDITQKIEYVEQSDKMDFIIRFLQTIDSQLVLVFVETKRAADHLEHVLCTQGMPATSIHGDRSQREREDALADFKSGRRPVIVATDVASRGLDIPNVAYVINYDMPGNIDDYVHRIGRTGRAGNIGNAISLVNGKNRNVIGDLYTLLMENEQEVPSFLEEMRHSFGGYRRGGGGKSRFGGRDMRQQYKGSRRDGGGRRGGGGGGSRGFSDMDRAPPRPRPQQYTRGGGGSKAGGGGGGAARGGAMREDNSAW